MRPRFFFPSPSDEGAGWPDWVCLTFAQCSLKVPPPVPSGSSQASSTEVYAELLSIGDEILAGDIVNTNAAYLGERCRSMGLVVRRTEVVRDRVGEIVAALGRATAHAQVCLVSGGLGPTTDDLTTVAIAQAAGVPVQRDAEALQRLEAKFRAFGRPMPAANCKQADFPAGATILPNPIGSAEGFNVRIGECEVFVMPGVPRELHLMMRDQVEPRVRSSLQLQPIPRRIYRLLGRGESSVAQSIEPVIAQARTRSPELEAMFVHYRASMPEVQVVLEATANEAGRRATAEQLASLDDALVQVLAPALYGIGQASLAPRLLRALERAGATVATAESCTGGGTAKALAAVPGASTAFLGGVVAYDNRIKQQVLGVPESLLAEHGAVSEPVARAMAEGARQIFSADLCVSITGVAGPTGGSPEKPVGTVHIAVADTAGTEHRRLSLRGDRGTVQRASELWALKLLWDRLLAQGLATIEEMDP